MEVLYNDINYCRLHIVCVDGDGVDTHHYDIGFRYANPYNDLFYGIDRLAGEPPRFFEDFVDDYEEVYIVDLGRYAAATRR